MVWQSIWCVKAENIKKILDTNMHKYVICTVVKSKHKAIHKTLLLLVNKSLKKVYIDLISKMLKLINEYEYILPISDNYTKQCWVVLLKHKSEAYKWLKAWIKSVKARNKSKIGFIRCSKGGKFDFEEFKVWVERKKYIFE